MEQPHTEEKFDRDEFLQKWQSAFREADRQTKFLNEGWQGPRAHHALKKLGLLDTACFYTKPGAGASEEFRVRWTLKEFAYLVKTYWEAGARVEFKRNELKAKVDPLVSAKTILGNVGKRTLYESSLRDLARSMVKALDTEISRITAEVEDEVWNQGIVLDRIQLREVAPGPIRGMDLEARFQVRIAYLLMKHLHRENCTAAAKLKFANFARLVALFYLSAGLAIKRADSHDLTCIRNTEPLNVRNVEQNLRRASLHKWRWSRAELRPPKGTRPH